ncbi:MAG: tRNA pseudouridine(38-40) synthase TruA [Chloroflexi bacterium]|nr:tRNA pseudouridine(38-40) synthase TruA [Chloroflexota bacterium]
MARYQVILAYDGSGFSGSQRQAKTRTVQGELEKSLRRLGWGGESIMLAGRTDSGVHASGQVAAFDFEWAHPDQRLLQALNSELPSDISVRGICRPSKDFHPRFDAVSRKYQYRLFFDPCRDPLRERYSWRLWPDFNGRNLAELASIFLGKHNYASFGSSPNAKGSTFRIVTKAGWRRLSGNEWLFEVQADGFLYRMVRRMVFLQVAVAQGKCAQSEVEKALDEQIKLPAGLAPAQGLTLVEVQYGSN